MSCGIQVESVQVSNIEKCFPFGLIYTSEGQVNKLFTQEMPYCKTLSDSSSCAMLQLSNLLTENIVNKTVIGSLVSFQRSAL